jgi:hypothetical protein
MSPRIIENVPFQINPSHYLATAGPVSRLAEIVAKWLKNNGLPVASPETLRTGAR